MLEAKYAVQESFHVPSTSKDIFRISLAQLTCGMVVARGDSARDVSTSVYVNHRNYHILFFASRLDIPGSQLTKAITALLKVCREQLKLKLLITKYPCYT